MRWLVPQCPGLTDREQYLNWVNKCWAAHPPGRGGMARSAGPPWFEPGPGIEPREGGRGKGAERPAEPEEAVLRRTRMSLLLRLGCRAGDTLAEPTLLATQNTDSARYVGHSLSSETVHSHPHANSSLHRVWQSGRRQCRPRPLRPLRTRTLTIQDGACQA